MSANVYLMDRLARERQDRYLREATQDRLTNTVGQSTRAAYAERRMSGYARRVLAQLRLRRDGQRGARAPRTGSDAMAMDPVFTCCRNARLFIFQVPRMNKLRFTWLTISAVGSVRSGGL